MPNTATAVNAGLTCLTLPPPDSNAEEVFAAVGHVIRVDEDHMGRATVLGACGIAFAMRYVRAATQAGIELGFQSDISQEIVRKKTKTKCGSLCFFFRCFSSQQYGLTHFLCIFDSLAQSTRCMAPRHYCCTRRMRIRKAKSIRSPRRPAAPLRA